MLNMQNKALAALVFTVLIWGITSAYARAFSLAASPPEALIIRTIISAAIFSIVLLLGPGFRIPRGDVPRVVGLSLFGMLGYYCCSVFGFAYAPAGLATLVFSVQPLMLALVAWLIGREKLTPMLILGLVISLIGTALLAFDDPASYQNIASNDILIGIGLMFCSCIFWTCYVVFMRDILQRHGAVKITGLSCVIIAVPLLPFVNGATLDIVRNLNADAWLALVFLTTLSATSSVVTWNYASAHLRPSLLGSSVYVIPIIAIVSSWLLLNEPITPIVIIASIVILAGVAISQWRRADGSTPAKQDGL